MAAVSLAVPGRSPSLAHIAPVYVFSRYGPILGVREECDELRLFGLLEDSAGYNCGIP